MLALLIQSLQAYITDYDKLINTIVTYVIKIIIGIVGGTTLISTIYLKYENKENAYHISKRRIFILMFFAIIGSVVFAPLIVEWFSLSGSFETFTGFACALLSNVIIEILILIGDTIKSYVPDMVNKKLNKIFKNEKDD